MFCAAAGDVGPERGEQSDSGQQPAEWRSHYGCTALGVTLAGPLGDPGCAGLYANSCYHGTRQVEEQLHSKRIEVHYCTNIQYAVVHHTYCMNSVF